jgi:NAD-dependent dihydropyrimidine dehydrogenase PreA subunit
MNIVKRKIIEIDEEKCDGCGLCVPSCAEGAIQVIDGKARLAADKFCDGLGACLGECPQGALRVIEREADEFDEAAVEEFLKASKLAAHRKAPAQTAPSMPCGCPSTQVRSFEPSRQGDAQGHGCPGQQVRELGGDQASALTHWPVQITLVPPSAPFLKGADLLVLADCVGPAYPRLHGDLMAGRTVLMGCPKLDKAEAYVEKFTEIFRSAGVRSVTVAMMEVPCCAGLNAIVEQARKAAGSSVPVEQVIISVKGEVLPGRSAASGSGRG